MSSSRIFNSLLFKIIVAILLGIVCSFFFPEWLARVFVTFNSLFSGFLGFFVPVLIFGAVFAVLSWLAGVGLGWLTALAGSVKIINWLTLPTAFANMINAVVGLAATASPGYAATAPQAPPAATATVPVTPPATPAPLTTNAK